MFKRRADIVSLIAVHVGVDQRCRARVSDEESSAQVPNSTSGVVMDITAFKVSYSVDIDATALRAARARSSSMGAMEELSGKV